METLFGCKTQCSKCDSGESLMWHPADEGIQCNDCLQSAQLALKVLEKEDQKSAVSAEKPKSPPKKSIRSTRSYKTRQNPNALPKPAAPKGKGRRQIFKKTAPVKLPTARATNTVVDSFFHNSEAYRVGDIVSLLGDDREIYYAQINGLMIDQYGDKSASITWLVPNRVITNRNEFDPMDYRVFYRDDIPRSMDCLEFVMHSPMEYYRNNSQPSSNQAELCTTIWGRLSHL